MKLYICDVCGTTLNKAKGFQFREIRHLCASCECKIGNYIQELTSESEQIKPKQE